MSGTFLQTHQFFNSEVLGVAFVQDTEMYYQFAIYFMELVVKLPVILFALFLLTLLFMGSIAIIYWILQLFIGPIFRMHR